MAYSNGSIIFIATHRVCQQYRGFQARYGYGKAHQRRDIMAVNRRSACDRRRHYILSNTKNYERRNGPQKVEFPHNYGNYLLCRRCRRFDYH